LKGSYGAVQIFGPTNKYFLVWKNRLTDMKFLVQKDRQ